ncbi:MAG TPA: hypothetical protein VNS32_07370 [Flavisolibacter sp.]|nr:hypothetical protein [Flavisolibacter sp.]
MKPIFLFLFLIPTLAFSQSSAYIKFNIGSTYTKGYDPIYELRADGGIRIQKDILLGIGAGLTKFKHVDPLYIPVFANFTYAYHSENKAFPLITIQPGYGIFKQQITEGTSTYNQKGGFCYFAGGGVGFSSKHKMKSLVQIGYNSFTFKNPSTTPGGFSVKLGLSF